MKDHPNILFILTDQQRLSAVSCYGETPCRTPNIDRLAEEGIRFSNTYTAQPICSPTRGSLMTGLYSHAHGITANVGEIGCTMHHLADGPDLLSRRLQEANYQLGYSGKWHLCPEPEEYMGHKNQHRLPQDYGFEGQNILGNSKAALHCEPYREYLKQHGFEHRLKPWNNPTYPIRPAGELEGPPESTVASFVTQNTLDLIDRFARNDNPFFIWHNFWGPHEPYYVPKEYLDLYRDVPIPRWGNYDWPARTIPGPHHVKLVSAQERLQWEDWEMIIRHYYAFATMVDDQIGRMIQALEDQGILEDTVIIFASDHGDLLGSHGGLYDKGWHHFEESHRIPCIIRLPQAESAGSVRSELTSFVDLYPTILDAAGQDWDNERVHGDSLLPLTRGQTEGWKDSVVTEFGGVNNTATTQRTLRWKHLKFGFNIDHEDELYDLEDDPHELHNLIQHPAYQNEVREMRLKLKDWMEETDDPALFRYSLQLRYHLAEDYREDPPPPNHIPPQ